MIKAQPFDTMQYFYGSVQNPVIRCTIRFCGRIETDDLRRAIRRLLSVYPILRCAYDFKKQEWKRARFTEKDYFSVETRDGKDTGAENATSLSSLAIGVDAPIRLNLTRLADHDTLSIRVSHLLCDGSGFKQLLYTLAALYSDSVSEPVGTDRSFRQIIRTIPLTENAKMLFSKKSSVSSGAKRKLPFTGENGEAKLLIRQLDPNSFLSAGRYAKTHHASLNDIFMTAYFKALHTMFQWDEISLPCPVDLRRYCNGAQPGLCNLTGEYHCAVRMGKNASFDDILHSVSAQMARQKGSDHCLKEPALYHILYHLMPCGLLEKIFPRIAPVAELSYSNLGMLDEKKLVFQGAEIADAHMTTAVKPAPYFQLSVSTFRDICTLSCCTSAQGDDLEMLQELMDEICGNLMF